MAIDFKADTLAHVLQQPSGLGFLSDGICLDAEGAVWVAEAIHGRLIRVAEGGRILEERATAGVGVFACVAPTYQETEASANHRASIVMTKVEVPRAGLP